MRAATGSRANRGRSIRSIVGNGCAKGQRARVQRLATAVHADLTQETLTSGMDKLSSAWYSSARP